MARPPKSPPPPRSAPAKRSSSSAAAAGDGQGKAARAKKTARAKSSGAGAARREGTARAARREPFVFDDTVIAPGTVGRVDIPVGRLPPDTSSRLPVWIAHGRYPGPVVWLSAAIHGDELNGVAIVREVFAQLRPKALAGTVLAVPVVNVFGILQQSRYLPDRRDLNRSFPGSPRGSLASRLAHLFFDSIVRRCSLGIDFHTGSNGRANLPQIRCDLDTPDTLALATAFGPPLVLDAKLRDGSLRSAAADLGTPVLLYEAGEALRFDEHAIGAGVRGTLRVLRARGMVDDAPDPPDVPPVVALGSTWTRAGRSGFCHLSVELGDRVEDGQVVGRVVDTVGGKGRPVHARHGGVVIGRSTSALVYRGDAVVHVAKVDAWPPGVTALGVRGAT
ncbi:MAG: succinylglutamate desuccinylase/aspartoacylase family protein [Myxococcales bacterium]|nr:succinylglutamate desuccinylase/aspartoacylase family protein [Myxococcales bacterium]